MAARDEVRTVGAGGRPPFRETSAPPGETSRGGWFVGPRDAPDRYELLGEGIAGGEGVTWRARYRGGLDGPLPLAIKMLYRPESAAPGWPSDAERSRWRDQTALLRHLQLDHVVRVNEILAGPAPHRLGETPLDGDSIILEMEWVDGPTLADLVRGRPVTPAVLAQRLDLIADACTALSQLHSHTRTAGNPTVHRDVTPSNCIVSPERGLVLIDVSTMQLPSDGIDVAGRHTPPYSGPEVLASPYGPREPSADVYAVGALTYFCLTGEDPPPPTTRVAKLSVRGRLDETARRMGWGSEVTTHVLRALDPEPSRRPTDLQAWAAGLRRRCTPRRAVVLARASRRPRVLVPLVVVALGTLGTAAFVARQTEETTTSAATPVKTSAVAPVATSAAAPVTPSAAAPVTPSAAAPVTTVTRTAQAAVRAPSSVRPAPTGRITAPRTRASVKDCSHFAGTARLPPGLTLVLAARNLTNGDPTRYMQVVFGFERPENLATWRGTLYFNEGSTGQPQSVELIALTVEQARTADNSDAATADAIVRGGKVLDAIDVVRASGPDRVTRCDAF